MADILPQERTLPFLVDRLTDDDPATRMESREKRSISMRQFQKALLRDLTWLLNSPSKTDREHIEEFPEVGRSVLNFGMPDFTGLTHSDVTPQQVEKAIRQAILLFEPRIVKDSLVIRVVVNRQVAGNLLAVEIRGQVWAQPVPEQFFVKTEVDLETGQVNLSDQLHG
ncbi:MAG: type VI secretion system baseplate subunit TssE [Tepidisphaerales bacterium]